MAKRSAIQTQPHLLHKPPRPHSPQDEVEELRLRLAEAEETLRAIQSGEVDAVVVSGPQGQKVFTLRGAEYAYRALVEAMNEGAATLAPNGVILYCNSQVPAILRLAPEKVIGSQVKTLIAKADKAAFDALFGRAVAGESCKAEIQLLVSDGTTTPVYLSLSRVRTDDTPAVCMVVTDLREHKQRDELIAAGNLAHSILQHAREAIAVCDRKGRVILANDALQALCVNPLFQELDSILPLQVPASAASVEARTMPFYPLPAALDGETVRAEQVVFRRSDRKLFWLLVTAGPLLNDDQVVGSVLTLVDNSRHKMAEKALLRSEKLAATGQLAATIAHEINNPLSAIYNLLYLVEHENRLEPARAHATTALKELARVSHITKQTLAFYRESNRPETLHVAEVLDDIVALLKKDLQTKQIACDCKYQVRGEICAYPGEMRQVFSNLIRNAIEALPERGRIRMGIRQARRAGTDGVAVFVCDNGGGIAPEVRGRIFEPFFTTKGRKGTGLGLWVASNLVQKHGGMIRVRSSCLPGRSGSCFYVFLPSGGGAAQRDLGPAECAGV